jgi:hypothetical protein
LPGRGIEQKEDGMSGFKINVSHQYVYAFMSALYLFQGLGLESIYVWLSFSIGYALLALKT